MYLTGTWPEMASVSTSLWAPQAVVCAIMPKLEAPRAADTHDGRLSQTSVLDRRAMDSLALHWMARDVAGILEALVRLA